MRLGTLIALALAAGAAAAAVAPQDEGACGRIAAACRAAGFVRGGAAGGDGLLVDCLVPLVRGTARPHKTSKPLPRIGRRNGRGRLRLPLPPERKATLRASLEGLRKCQGARACESAAGR